MAIRGMEPLTKPYNKLDVDMELWDLLDLAHDDELYVLHDILHGAYLFCPINVFLEKWAQLP